MKMDSMVIATSIGRVGGRGGGTRKINGRKGKTTCTKREMLIARKKKRQERIETQERHPQCLFFLLDMSVIC